MARIKTHIREKIYMGKGKGKGKGKGNGKGISSEALSFPAAGSLKRQLVSPKRGRARNK